jgi:membrane protein
MAKTIDSLKSRAGKFVEGRTEDLGRWERILQFQVHLWRFCALRLKDNNAMAMSSALSFRTIFALVPILILAFLLLKSVGVLDDSKRVLRQFLEESGMTQIQYPQQGAGPGEGPAATAARPPSWRGEGERGVTVADKIEGAIDHLEGQLTVGTLGPIGAVLLIWTALTLLMTMERSLNRIFEAPRPRSLARRIVIYWTVVTLGPLVLVAAFYAGSKATSIVEGWPVVSYLLAVLGWIVPLVLGVLFLGGVYALMPNTIVRWKAAVIGAAVAFPVWLIGRWAFSLYVEHAGAKSLYGALALIPLFLMWLNFSWLIFLLGAQLAYAAGNLERVRSGARSSRHIISHWDVLAAAVAVALGSRAKEAPVALHDVSAQLGLSEDAAEQVLAILAAHGVVCRTADDTARTFLLAKPADRIRVADLLELGSADRSKAAAVKFAPDVEKSVAQVRSRSSAGIEGLTIAALTAT